MSIVVTGLHFYPVKSCRGTDLTHAVIDKCGIKNDRSFMVVRKDGMFLTQRQCAKFALVHPSLTGDDTIRLTAPGMEPLVLCRSNSGAAIETTVWNDNCPSIDQGDEAASWFSKIIGVTCRLVSMEASHVRSVDPLYASAAGQQVGFADGFPFLLTSEESLEDLNSKMEYAVPMNRFRPNIVVRGCAPFAEDSWKSIRIGEMIFDVVKPCTRCVTTTVDQDDASKGKEPLRTLAAYRRFDDGLRFGQNLVHHTTGSISVGDSVEIIS